MDTIVNAFLFHGPDDIEKFPITVTDANYQIVIKKIEFEQEKIVNYLKILKKEGLINSLFRPKNKKYQSVLDELVKIKRGAKDSLNKIKTIYYK